MIEYIWDIRDMKNNVADGGVFEAHWVCAGLRSKTDAQGQEHTYEISNRGTCTFNPTPTDASFTPLANLTKEQVLGWVWQTVDKAAVEQEIADGLEATYFNNPVDMTLPWASST